MSAPDAAPDTSARANARHPAWLPLGIGVGLAAVAALAALGWSSLRSAHQDAPRTAARAAHLGAPLAARAAPAPAGSAQARSAQARSAQAGTTPSETAQTGSFQPEPPAAAAEVTVGRNDTLDSIFRRLQVSRADLAMLRALPGLRQDFDRLRTGETLTVLHRGGELLGLMRRLSLAETLKVERGATGFQAHLIQNPLETRVRTVSGTIDHSLFEAMAEAGAHDQTVIALSDIFRWEIDFWIDLRPGDSFTLTYQETYENGRYAGDGPILAARFVNRGREYLAVRYVAPDGKADYYTADGRSLRKAFLRAPLAFTRVSSPFNLHRFHPILHRIRAHTGVDYAAPMGTPVHAAGDGRVIFAGRKGGYGNAVEIDHGHGITTVYGHLSRFAHGIRAGRRVTQGEVIAFVGMTGLATGPHLHYEYRVNGVYKNPQTVSLPDARPIPPALRADFLEKTAPLLASLLPPLGPALVSR